MNKTNTNKTSIYYSKYYSKYIKYKNKYNKLKQLRGGDIEIEYIYCGSFGCAYKLTINNQVYVLKGVKPDESNMNDMIYKSFVNELLKGIEISALCKKEENKEMSKYFCIPTYVPIYYQNNREELKQKICKFYKNIYDQQIQYYKSIYPNTEQINIMMDTTININNFLPNIDDKIDNYVKLVHNNIYDIRTKLESIEIPTKIDNEYEFKKNNFTYSDRHSYLWYITEYGGIDAFDYCKSSDIHTNITTCYYILQQVHKAMNFLHTNNIYHLDLRLQNICYNREHISFIDFSLSRNKNELKYINESDTIMYNDKLKADCINPPDIYWFIISCIKNQDNLKPDNRFSIFYNMKNAHKIKQLESKANLKKLRLYDFTNRNNYYNKYGLKWVDYMGVGLGFLDFFIFLKFQHIDKEYIYNNDSDNNEFNKIFRILLSWCMVDYTKRNDKFKDTIKFNLDYKKTIKGFFNRNIKLNDYYEFIYKQLDS